MTQNTFIFFTTNTIWVIMNNNSIINVLIRSYLRSFFYINRFIFRAKNYFENCEY